MQLGFLSIKFLNRFLEEHNIPVPQKEANKTTVDFKLANHYIDEIKDLYKNDTTVQRNYPIGSVDLNRNHSSDVLV